MTVLLVDDDPLTSRLFELALLREKLAVAKVSSAAEGLEWLQRNHASVIVTDMILGGPSGLDLIETLRADARWQRLPVIVVTGVAERGLVEEFARLGVRHFLVKPVRPTALVERVRLALAESPVVRDELAATGRLGLWERDERLLLETSEVFLSTLSEQLKGAMDSGDHAATLDVARRLVEPARLLGAERSTAAVDELGRASTELVRDACEQRVVYELEGLRNAVGRALGRYHQ